MKTIRHKVFETNSSSTHSISISNEVELLESITPDENGNIILTGGEFGWAWERFNDALTKANYCAVDQKCNESNKKLLLEVLKEQTGAKDVIFNFTDNHDDLNWSYIDHESVGTSNIAFESKDSLRNFIFNPKCFLYTGNDNEYAPPNFYDKPGTEYNYILKLEVVSEKLFETKFVDSPTEEGIKEALKVLLKKYCDSISGKYFMGYKAYSDRWDFYDSGDWSPLFTSKMERFTPWDRFFENKVIIYNEKGMKYVNEETSSYRDGRIFKELKVVDFALTEIKK